YLSCDIWRERGVLPAIDVEFHNAGAALFGVATYVPALMEYVEKYRINLKLESNLVAVDADRRIATFERKQNGVSERIERGFDMLHV
ncbi:pyridine nucleotide-disulfide oxidoreductase, partial [Rhizobium brockwellii]